MTASYNIYQSEVTSKEYFILFLILSVFRHVYFKHDNIIISIYLDGQVGNFNIAVMKKIQKCFLEFVLTNIKKKVVTYTYQNKFWG